MNRLSGYIASFHFLSLDVAIGVLIQALVIQKFTGYTFSVDYFILLPLSTLIIYWLDRLLDVHGLDEGQVLTEKHRFYRRYFGVIAGACLLIGLLLLLYGGLWGSAEVRHLGFYGGIWMGLYFLVHHLFRGSARLIFLKELMVAGTYSLVLWIFPLWDGWSLWKFLAFFYLFLNALWNLWWISILDYEVDRALGVHSFAQVPKARQMVHGLMWIIFLLSVGMVYGNGIFGACYDLMFLGHCILFYRRDWGFYRVYLEVVFWLPGVYVFFC